MDASSETACGRTNTVHLCIAIGIIYLVYRKLQNPNGVVEEQSP